MEIELLSSILYIRALPKREIIDGVLYQLKNGCSWGDVPKDLPPYSTVYWHYKQWRASGAIEKLMTLLHEAIREQVKKKENGPL
jgi:transposase